MIRPMRFVPWLLAGAAGLASLAAVLAWRAGLPADAEAVSGLVLPPPAEIRLTTARIEAKDAVVDRLLAGEITLLEAAAWFRQVCDNPPDYRVDFRRNFAGDSDGEKACRHVIAWVNARVWSLHGQAQAELAEQKYQRELDSMLATGRPIELPW
jgi:hypothetical protein